MSQPERTQVTVVDVKIPFWSMVILLVKWALAAIPAIIILVALSTVLTMLFAFVTGGGFSLFDWFGRGTV
jgi:hypothetical protein